MIPIRYLVQLVVVVQLVCILQIVSNRLIAQQENMNILQPVCAAFQTLRVLISLKKDITRSLTHHYDALGSVSQ